MNQVEKYCGFDASEMEAKIKAQDPKALAYSWILGYLEDLNYQIDTSYWKEERDLEEITFEGLMYVADSHIKQSAGGNAPEGDDKQSDGTWYWPEYIIRAGVFESYCVDPLFWQNYAILKDVDFEQLKNESGLPGFFSCSC